MREHLRDGLNVCAMPELLFNAEAMLLAEKVASFLIHLLKRAIHNTVHSD